MLNFFKKIFNKKELDNPVFCENCYYFGEENLTGKEICKHSANIKYFNTITYKRKGKSYYVKKPRELNKDNNCSWYWPSAPLNTK